jgi:hypothetical protein
MRLIQRVSVPHSTLTTKFARQPLRSLNSLDNLVVCDSVIYRDFQVLTNAENAEIFWHDRCVITDPGCVNEQLNRLNLESAVCLRTAEHLLFGFNAFSQRNNALERSMLGKRLRNLPAGSSRHLDECTDQALEGGANMLSFGHDAQAADGRYFRWSTLKTRIFGQHDVDFCWLTITRPVSLLASAAAMPCQLLSEQLLMYRQLGQTDRRICQGIAVGDLTEEIAAHVGLTRRSVEVRRSKILEHFGFSKKVQIVRLMVRLEENGLLPD